MQAVIDDMQSDLPRGATVALAGQASTMPSAYTQLLEGLALSIVLVFLVIVVNFQSWLDPMIVISALPAALAGATWSLFLTGTTLSVPALTGAIMSMGTATANTVLVVDFARAQLAAHGDAGGRGDRGGSRPDQAGADDRAGDDRGHVPDVVQQHHQCAPGPCRHRRPDRRDRDDPACSSLACSPSSIAAGQGSRCSYRRSQRECNETPRPRLGDCCRGHRGGARGRGYGIWNAASRLNELQQLTDDSAIPRVQVTTPKPGPTERTVTLSGNVVAWNEAPIYAQVSGYVTKWYKDYGAHVEKGELLAEIDAPGLDAQYKASLAQLDTAVTNYNLAAVTAKR